MDKIIGKLARFFGFIPKIEVQTFIDKLQEYQKMPLVVLKGTVDEIDLTGNLIILSGEVRIKGGKLRKNVFLGTPLNSKLIIEKAR